MMILAADVPPQLLGPVGALALSLVVNGLFYAGRILPRNAVPREDFRQVQDMNADLSARMSTLTTSVDQLVTVVRYQQKNGTP